MTSQSSQLSALVFSNGTKNDSSIDPLNCLTTKLSLSSNFGYGSQDDLTSDGYNHVYDRQHWTPHDICSYSSLGNVKMVTSLLKEGANVNQTDSKGWTPIMHAAHMGHFSVLQILISQPKVDVNAQEPEYKRTALMLAASMGHTRCVSIIVSHRDADLTVVDSYGRDAASYAETHGHGKNHLMAKYLNIGKDSSKNGKSVNVPSFKRTNERGSPNDIWRPEPSSSTSLFQTMIKSPDINTLVVNGNCSNIPCPPKKSSPFQMLSHDQTRDGCRRKLNFTNNLPIPVMAASSSSPSVDDSCRPITKYLDVLLTQIGLSMYCNFFSKMDFKTFSTLSAEQFEKLGIPIEHIQILQLAQICMSITIQAISLEQKRLQEENNYLKKNLDSLNDITSKCVQWVEEHFVHCTTAERRTNYNPIGQPSIAIGSSSK